MLTMSTTVTTKINMVDDEYVIYVFVNGKRLESADYFTDCKQDAADTAKYIKAHALTYRV